MRLSINFKGLSAGIAYLILGALGTTFSVNAQTYGLRIANKTTGSVIGDVEYTTPGCRGISFRVEPGQTWSNDQSESESAVAVQSSRRGNPLLPGT